jgi:hypothetical protein
MTEHLTNSKIGVVLETRYSPFSKYMLRGESLYICYLGRYYYWRVSVLILFVCVYIIIIIIARGVSAISEASVGIFTGSAGVCFFLSSANSVLNIF